MNMRIAKKTLSRFRCPYEGIPHGARGRYDKAYRAYYRSMSRNQDPKWMGQAGGKRWRQAEKKHANCGVCKTNDAFNDAFDRLAEGEIDAINLTIKL